MSTRQMDTRQLATQTAAFVKQMVDGLGVLEQLQTKEAADQAGLVQFSKAAAQSLVSTGLITADEVPGWEESLQKHAQALKTITDLCQICDAYAKQASQHDAELRQQASQRQAISVGEPAYSTKQASANPGAPRSSLQVLLESGSFLQ